MYCIQSGWKLHIITTIIINTLQIIISSHHYYTYIIITTILLYYQYYYANINLVVTYFDAPMIFFFLNYFIGVAVKYLD